MTTFYDYDIEASEEQLRKDYLGCVYAKALPSQVEDAMSYLVLLDNKDISGDGDHRWCIMGDLRAAWGIEDTFAYIEDDKALFGHYIVRRDILAALPEELESVEIDPEGGTWFSYAPDADTGHQFIDWVATLITDMEGQTA